MIEPPAFYAAVGLNVETYDARTERDLVGTSVEGDLGFYLDRARQIGGPVLDLGGGTGRIAWALAGEGHEVTLLDLSVGMITIAEAKRAMQPAEVSRRLRTVQADMTDFQLDQTFALVIAAFRAFMAVLTAAGQRHCLESVARHLQPGGVLLLDLFDPRLDLLLQTEPFTPELDPVRHPVSGNDVRIKTVSRKRDPMSQTFEELWRFTEIEPDGAVVRTEDEILTMRWTYRAEMRYLLELTGFTVDAEYGDFHGSPPVYGREQVWVARKLSGRRRSTHMRPRRLRAGGASHP